MEPGGLAGVARVGVERRNGLKRKRGWSNGAGLLVFPDARGFFGDTETRSGFLRGEMIGLEGDILTRGGVIGCRTRPKSIPRTSAVDVEDETVLAVDVSDTLRSSSLTIFGGGRVATSDGTPSAAEGAIAVTESDILEVAQSVLVIGHSPARSVLRGSAIVDEGRTAAESSGSCSSISRGGDGVLANNMMSLSSLADSPTCDEFAVGIVAGGSAVFWLSLTMPEISNPKSLGMHLSDN